MADDEIGAIGEVNSNQAAAVQAPPPQPAPVAEQKPQTEAPASINTQDSSKISGEAKHADGHESQHSLTQGIASWARRDPQADKPKAEDKPKADDKPKAEDKPKADEAPQADGATAAEGDKPAEGAKPTEGAKPVEGAKPAEGDKPAEAPKDTLPTLDASKGDLKRGAGLGKDGPSNDVKTLQERLSRAGLNAGSADGKFGAKTQQALSDFQRKNGLAVSGVADAKTMDALNKLGPTADAQKGAGAGTDPSKAGAAQQAAPDPAAPLSEPDQKKADFLSRYLQKNGAEGMPADVGEKIVRAAQANKMDPMLLAAIPGLETQWGKTGVGLKGMAGVGAYDANPRNAVNNPTFSGVDRQVNGAAKAFSANRARFGGNEDQPILKQLQAANGHGNGYSTSTKWAGKVYSVYQRLQRAYDAEQQQP